MIPSTTPSKYKRKRKEQRFHIIKKTKFLLIEDAQSLETIWWRDTDLGEVYVFSIKIGQRTKSGQRKFDDNIQNLDFSGFELL